MDSTKYQMLIGPIIGFTFTLATVLFVALFAHKTERPEVVATWYPPAGGPTPGDPPAPAPSESGPSA